MDKLEFLGGKYREGEQILPGVIQTYRAFEGETGREVFVHRIAASDDPAQQLVLYRLLSAALVRSASVRSMILDVSEEAGDWFVVTEIAHKCLLLREWLQVELNSSAKPAEPEKKPVELENKREHAETEFQPPAKASSGPSEFSRFFHKDEPAAPKTAAGERPSRTGFVQRPNTPTPFTPPTAPAVSRAAEPGEFTRIFAAKDNALPAANWKPSERHQSPQDFDNIFGRESEKATPVPPLPVGEYTRIFGPNSQPPPARTPSAIGEPVRHTVDDPLRAAEPVRSAAPAAGPSEFTRVTNGSRPPVAAPEAPAPAMAPPQLNIPAIPAPAIPSPKLPATAPASVPNTKLLLFFGVLGLMAALLILLIFLALRK